MPRTRFTARQMDAFVAVAELSSFTAAAQQLTLTTAGVSGLIADLELGIGVRLFERSTRRVTLSEAGRAFLPAALGVQRNLRSAELVADEIAAQTLKVVRIAAPMVIASVILPPLIAAFQAEHPAIEVSIIDTGVEWLADRVGYGEVDLAVGPDRVAEDNVHVENLQPSPWVVWLAPGHPLAAKKLLQWSDLKGSRFHAAGHDHDRIIKAAMDGLPEDQRIVPGQVFDNISTALGVAAAGLGITLCPAYVAPLATAFNLEMRRVIEPEFIRYISLYSPTNRTETDAARLFGDTLRGAFAP